MAAPGVGARYVFCNGAERWLVSSPAAAVAAALRPAGRAHPEEASSAPCGPDPAVHLDGIRAYTKADFDEVFVSQAGPDADGFFEFYAGQVLPRLRDG